MRLMRDLSVNLSLVLSYFSALCLRLRWHDLVWKDLPKALPSCWDRWRVRSGSDLWVWERRKGHPSHPWSREHYMFTAATQPHPGSVQVQSWHTWTDCQVSHLLENLPSLLVELGQILSCEMFWPFLGPLWRMKSRPPGRSSSSS